MSEANEIANALDEIGLLSDAADLLRSQFDEMKRLNGLLQDCADKHHRAEVEWADTVADREALIRYARTYACYFDIDPHFDELPDHLREELKRGD